MIADGGLKKRSGSVGNGVVQLGGVLAIVASDTQDLAGTRDRSSPTGIGEAHGVSLIARDKLRRDGATCGPARHRGSRPRARPTSSSCPRRASAAAPIKIWCSPTSPCRVATSPSTPRAAAIACAISARATARWSTGSASTPSILNDGDQIECGNTLMRFDQAVGARGAAVARSRSPPPHRRRRRPMRRRRRRPPTRRRRRRRIRWRRRRSTRRRRTCRSAVPLGGAGESRSVSLPIGAGHAAAVAEESADRVRRDGRAVADLAHRHRRQDGVRQAARGRERGRAVVSRRPQAVPRPRTTRAPRSTSPTRCSWRPIRPRPSATWRRAISRCTRAAPCRRPSAPSPAIATPRRSRRSTPSTRPRWCTTTRCERRKEMAPKAAAEDVEEARRLQQEDPDTARARLAAGAGARSGQRRGARARAEDARRSAAAAGEHGGDVAAGDDAGRGRSEADGAGGRRRRLPRSRKRRRRRSRRRRASRRSRSSPPRPRTTTTSRRSRSRKKDAAPAPARSTRRRRPRRGGVQGEGLRQRRAALSHGGAQPAGQADGEDDRVRQSGARPEGGARQGRRRRGQEPDGGGERLRDGDGHRRAHRPAGSTRRTSSSASASCRFRWRSRRSRRANTSRRSRRCRRRSGRAPATAACSSSSRPRPRS